MKLDWRRNHSFSLKSEKYAWSDVQRLATAHTEYYLIFENVCEQGFVKSVRHFGLFGRFWHLLGEKWNWKGMSLRQILQLYIIKELLLLLVISHLRAQVFQQPGLPSAVLSQVLWTLAVLCWHPYSWYGAFLHRFDSSCCWIVAFLHFGKKFNTHSGSWGALKKHSLPLPFSFLSWVPYSAILCLWIHLCI